MSAQRYRLRSGGAIDRTRPLTFTFDGVPYEGYAGDTLASALLANGVRLVGRSFKYHRPRGILTSGPEEPNALVELRSGARREPNTRATMVELHDGLLAASQNRWPALSLDLMALNGLASPLLHAGFYYKTFMWPASFWEKVYEPLIRRAAGLGRASGQPDPDTYEKAFLFCDVLVIGAGAAGLSAALVAARAGARVVLCDEGSGLGGHLLGERIEVGAASGSDWARAISGELAAMPDVRVMARTTVAGVYDHGTYLAVERVNDHVAVPPPFEPRQRLWRIVARRAVLATGAIERPLVFAGNDKPGVMLSGAVRTYLNRFAVAPGRRALVVGGDRDSTVRDLEAAGVEVVGSVAAECLQSVTGFQGVAGAEIRSENGRRVRLACDLVCMSGGWSPSLHLTAHLGHKPVWHDALAAFISSTLPAGLIAAGAVTGCSTTTEALRAGGEAGVAVARELGLPAELPELPHVSGDWTADAPVLPSKIVKGKAFVDFQNDVTADDVDLAQREGFRSVEHLKRYTTLGMATDQGKTSNVNGLALLAAASGRTPGDVGTTGYRPPYSPVAIGALAGTHRGRHFKPTRLPPSHAWAEARGAVFVETGQWLRAQWYPQAGDTDWLSSVCREVSGVRARVGVCDVSTLGKIDLQGPDAAEFLNRLYANTWTNLAVGRARYGVMLREDGFVMDDGTTSRLGPERFIVTTTTANAAKVLQHMEHAHQWLWPDLDVQFCSVSEQWAQFSVAGPRARDVLGRVIDPKFDLSNAAFPYMAAGETTALGGVQTRVFRLSFSGELAYEIAVPAGFGHALMERIMEAGAPFGILPYGTEALGVMRIEKGHVAGNEINGQTTAGDLGLGRMMSSKKDYIGRVMAGRSALVDPDRPTLVGVKPVSRLDRLRAGAHFLATGAAASASNDEGYLTSVAFSPTLGHWIGLGLLARGPSRHGEHIRAYDPVRGGDVVVEVCDPVFYDPQGERLRA